MTQAASVTRVGVAGLGRMGSPMAVNLASAGYEMLLWNRSRSKAEDLAVATGAAVCDTPRELAAQCDVVITMLADDEASSDVFMSPDGLFSATGGAGTIVSMGTHSPEHLHLLRARSTGATIIDAPVSGSIAAATDAQLLIMAGGTPEMIEPVMPLMNAIGRETICLGSAGLGATMKLVVNMLIHGLNQTVAEALVLAEASGVDINDAYRTLENSAAAAPMLHYRKANYLDEVGTPVSFSLSLARKDVELALRLAGESGLGLPQTQQNFAELRSAEARGFGDRDMAAILNYLREKA